MAALPLEIVAVVGQEQGRVGWEQGRAGRKRDRVGRKRGRVGQEQGRAGQEGQEGRVEVDRAVPGHQEPVGREDHCVWEYVCW